MGIQEKVRHHPKRDNENIVSDWVVHFQIHHTTKHDLLLVLSARRLRILLDGSLTLRRVLVREPKRRKIKR